MTESDNKPTKRRPLLRSLRSVLGLALMVVSLLGLVVSVAGLVTLARADVGALAELEDALDLSRSALDTTSETLILAEQLLGESASAFESLEAATLDVNQTLTDTDDVLASMTDVFGDELPAIIVSSQQSLGSAQDSAQVIEGTLTGLNTISSLTGTRYDPDVTLAASLADLSDSLGAMPDSFERIAADLEGAGEGLDAMDSDLVALSADFENISATLTESQTLMADYRAIVDELADSIGNLMGGGIARALKTARMLGLFLLLWFGLTQIGLLFQGWEMVSGERQLRARVRALEETVGEMTRDGE